MRLVDADLIIETCNSYKGMNRRADLGIKLVNKIVSGAPTVDAKPIQHGYWLYDRLCSTNGGTYGVQRCSNCGYYYKDFGDEWNYCPHCGALMDMDEVEE